MVRPDKHPIVGRHKGEKEDPCLQAGSQTARFASQSPAVPLSKLSRTDLCIERKAEPDAGVPVVLRAHSGESPVPVGTDPKLSQISKARSTMMMGKGISDFAGGFKVRSAWGRASVMGGLKK